MKDRNKPIAPRYLGAQGIRDDDRRDQGSRFDEVREALFANPYQPVWGAPDADPLPVYKVTLGSVLKGILPFGRPYQFLAAARRTVDAHTDLRWGTHGKGFRRLLHTNGICLVGEWEITEETPYTGHFAKGSHCPMIGRYSTCCTETRRGYTRSLSLVGKLFPPGSGEEPARTAAFFSQEDLGGEDTSHINNAELRNAPDTRSWRRGLGVPILLVTGAVFMRADREPSHRQVYEIAELGKPAGEPTNAPEFMRLLVAEDQPLIPGNKLDFRDEIMGQIYDRGDPEPKRKLVFNIETSDHGTTQGLPIYQRRHIRSWRRIGRMVFHEAVASYNGDFVIHFHHPAWRKNRNDPATQVTSGDLR